MSRLTCKSFKCAIDSRYQNLNMANFETSVKRRYSDTLKANFRDQKLFDIALFPPVERTQFNVGTVFSRKGDGEIETHGGMVSILYS
jgi:hypothetical protein